MALSAGNARLKDIRKLSRRSVRTELAPALGLVLGFNATDGD